MLTRVEIATAAVLLGCGSAYAQAPLNVSPLPPLGITSPLGIANAPVGHTGIPIGATELATPGVSPTTFGVSPLIGATCAGASATGAYAATGNSNTTLSGSALFDGGGMTATAPGPCAASATASVPLASSMGPGSSVGPVGIPLGSTEIGGGGLSPPSVALSPNPFAPAVSLLTPLSGITPPSTPSISALSTPTCPYIQNGAPTITGTPTTFGAPKTGTQLGRQALTGCP